MLAVFGVFGLRVTARPPSATEGGTALLDLSGLDTSPQSPPSFPEFPTPTDSLNAPSQEIGISLLDDELMSLGNERAWVWAWWSPGRPAGRSGPWERGFFITVASALPSGLSEGTHPSNPPSQPEDSTAWDSFQVKGGGRVVAVKR